MNDVAAVYDRLDRTHLHQLNFMHFARTIPGYAGMFTGRVPDEFIALVGHGMVEVACPCKVVPGPRCAFLVPTACACGRMFVYTGVTVRVGYDTDSFVDYKRPSAERGATESERDVSP